MIANAKCPLCNKPPHACECGRELARQGVSWEISPHLRLVLELTSSLGDALRGAAEKSATRVLLVLENGITLDELRKEAPRVLRFAKQAWGNRGRIALADLGWREARERLEEMHRSGTGYGAIAQAVNSTLQECVQHSRTEPAELFLRACGFGPRRAANELESARLYMESSRLPQWCPVTDEHVKDALRKRRGTRATGGGATRQVVPPDK